MQQALRPHPGFRCSAVTEFEAEATRQEGAGLTLRYRVTGVTRQIIMPAPATNVVTPTDGLWRSTCFEAFIQARPEGPYYELNLAPSGAWAAYRFDGYRHGMTPVAAFPAPCIEVGSHEQVFELRACLDLGLLDDLPADVPWRLGLSAVIQDTEGAMSYWALAHPAGRPDFHHPHGFAAALPPEGRL